jgi:DNA-binding transcriptional LysR family regulator
MNNFDRRQLRYFVAVAEELHFGRAARRVHISQPPLSQQIAALEQDLGVKLFVRSKRKVEITAAGLQFLKDARAILEDMQRARQRVRAAAEGKTGILRIGLNYTAPLNPLLSRIMRRFGQLHPGVQLELHENTSAKQLDGLYRHTLDLCFIWPTRDDASSEISLRPLSRDPLRLVMGDEHDLAHKKNIDAKDLRNFPLYLTARQTRTEFFDALLEACLKSGFEPDIRTNVIQMPFILNVAVASGGLAFLPEFLTRIRPPGTLFRPCRFLPSSSLIMPLSLAYRARDASPLVKNFLSVLE